jgi:hypothetical protein
MASPLIAEIATVLFMTSLFAAMISFHNAVARAPRDENAWHRLTAPALAAVALLAMVWTGLANDATLLGVPPGSTESWAFPAAFGVVAVAGVLYGLWLRSARPAVYRGVGLGAESRERARRASRGRPPAARCGLPSRRATSPSTPPDPGGRPWQQAVRPRS